MQTIQYANNLNQNTNRGPSDSIWLRCPVLELLENFERGIYFADDFVMTGSITATAAATNLGQWSAWADANGVLLADPAQEGGVMVFSDGGNSAVGVTIASNAGAFRFQTGSTAYTLQRQIWFEARVAVGSITTAERDAFIGLADNTTEQLTGQTNGLIASTTNTLNTDPNLFGFHFRSTTHPTDVGLAFNVAGGTVQYPTNLQTLVTSVTGSALTAYAAGSNGAAASGFVKLGFVFNQFAPTALIGTASSGQTANTTAKQLIQVFVNGYPTAAFLTAAANVQVSTFPSGFLSPAIAYKSRGTAGGGFYVDWIRVAQLANI